MCSRSTKRGMHICRTSFETKDIGDSCERSSACTSSSRTQLLNTGPAGILITSSVDILDLDGPSVSSYLSSCSQSGFLTAARIKLLCLTAFLHYSVLQKWIIRSECWWQLMRPGEFQSNTFVLVRLQPNNIIASYWTRANEQSWPSINK